ncbi:MAG: NAD(P)-dependent oxidoreductase [Actinomycetota bacterium]|nr:NAD(P)-dependent oxidoreductase [Actinomycetota bacterium]
MAAEPRRIGWIGAGRMGYELILRLLAAGYDVAVWNRTRAKAEPLTEHGATIVDTPADLADRDVVVTMVSSSAVFEDVTMGPAGLLSGECGPRVLVDSSTISAEASQRVAAEAAKYDTAVLAAPVSGNPKVVKSGKLTVVVSGDAAAFDEARPVLETFGHKVTYVGGGAEARLVKICHNVLLGVVTQSLAEITILAERSGVSRADFLEFINSSVMGSVFTRYKTPALVNLDFTPTFTGHLLRKDLELGLSAGREHNVPLPVAAMTHQLVLHLIGNGRGDVDFAALLELEAQGAGLELRSENREVSTGLEPEHGVG